MYSPITRLLFELGQRPKRQAGRSSHAIAWGSDAPRPNQRGGAEMLVSIVRISLLAANGPEATVSLSISGSISAR